MRTLPGILATLALTLVAGFSEANSVTVRGDAAFGGPGFHLVAIVVDPGLVPPNDAWAGIGPDRGMSEETQIVASFVVDPGRLWMAASTPEEPHHLCFLGLSETADWTTARVILFLERGPDRSWLIGARLWDDALARYVVVGPSFLVETTPTVRRSPRGAVSSSSGIRVDFEWHAASEPGAQDGVFRLFRGVDQGRELVLERTGLSSGTQRLSFLRVGVVNAAHQARSTVGTLSLDEVRLSRTFGPAEASAP